MRPTRRRAARGLTLMEVLAALGLAAALLAAAFLFVSELLESRERTRSVAARQGATMALLDRLEQDLELAIAFDPALGAGVRGDEGSLVLLTRGSALDPSGMGLGDLARREYRFDPAARRVLVRGEAARGPRTASFHALEAEIALLRLRYWNGEEWSERYDSAAAGGLPVAVEASVWFVLPEEVAEPDAAADEDDFDDFLAPGIDAAEDAPSAIGVEPRATSGRDLPPPDRRRLVLVPDARPPAEAVDGAPLGAAATDAEAAP